MATSIDQLIRIDRIGRIDQILYILFHPSVYVGYRFLYFVHGLFFDEIGWFGDTDQSADLNRSESIESITPG